MKGELSFCNLSGRNTACADISPRNRSLDVDFDSLEIGEEAAQCFPDNL